MSPALSRTPPPPAGSTSRTKKDPRLLILDILIGLLVLLVGGMLYAFLARHVFQPPVEAHRTGPGPTGVIQLDVLNGCGVAGAATAFTSYLRSRGYDVVEQRNYRTFDVGESMVIDRTGNRKNAESVAYALGIRNDNIIQQINPDYFVDVSVLIGKDYKSLKPSQ